MTARANDASPQRCVNPAAQMSPTCFLALFDPQQINSGVYFAAAALLIFLAAVLAGRKVQQRLPAKALVGIVAVTVLTLTLIWLLLSALNRKETTPSPPPTDYSAPTGTP